MIFPLPALPDPEPGPTEKPHYHGHRERLRQRFLTTGAESFQDYELLELLLFPAIPRKDVKSLAKSLLAAFETLWGVVNAPHHRLREQFRLGDTVIAQLAIVGATALRMTRRQIAQRHVLGSWQAVLEYCEAVMAHETVEQLRLLFLDRRNSLIADEVQQRGTVDHTPVYPREVIKRALELGATAIILVHNHPSGDPTPSRADIDMTHHIIRAAEGVGIKVHDHIIVGRGRHSSMKNMGLI
ncbi:MAG: DNA repair protein RadC [Pseudomonadota bacterium]|nr:DNA repair protein RadC [Pseudomonadota bacterium]